MLPALLLPLSVSQAQDVSRVIPPSGVIGVQEAMLSPDYWIARTAVADRQLLTPARIDAINRESFATDPALRYLSRIAPVLPQSQVAAWLKEASAPLTGPLVDAGGTPIPVATLTAITANMGADRIAATAPARYGLTVRRTPMRSFPSALKAYASKDSTDIEAFTAGVLFPGDAVIIVHDSFDRQWALVQTYQGPAWVAQADIAEGPADKVFAYAGRTPFRVVTGDSVRTVNTPEAPELSEVQLDMGARLPIADVPPDQPVNGQGPSESWVVALPVRGTDGALSIRPALLRKVHDSAAGYLPLTRANIIRQAFKFLGERYGWGHQFNARDCSGFTSDVYRSMGVILPPNSGAQGKSPAFPHQLFAPTVSHEERVRAIMQADVGDLVVVPGHVLMILGKVAGQPYVIQDVPYAVFHDPQGKLRMTKINQVSVTPLLPLLANEHQSYADAMTSLVHVTAAR